MYVYFFVVVYCCLLYLLSIFFFLKNVCLFLIFEMLLMLKS